MTANKKFKVPKNRPAFRNDKLLKEAAEKAAKAFKKEEEELKKKEYATT